jgi:hypothetical protein
LQQQGEFRAKKNHSELGGNRVAFDRLEKNPLVVDTISLYQRDAIP